MTDHTAERILVFDLNKTFYTKSSKDEFYKFICAKRPNRLLYYFQMGWYKFLLKVNQIRQTEFKENFFNYLDKLPQDEVKAYAQEFWEQEFPKNFNPELLQRFDAWKQSGHKLYCATGSLEVYLEPLFKLYKVDGYFGTQSEYDGETYVVNGEACKGKEKIRRLNKHFKGKPYLIAEGYSDAMEEIVTQAEKGFWLVNGKVVPLQERKSG